jgi:hypothetical protein
MLIDDPAFIKRHSEAVAKLGSTLEEISGSERLYPKELRLNVREFTALNSGYLERLVSNKNEKNIYEIVNEIQDKSNELIKKVEHIIFR